MFSNFSSSLLTKWTEVFVHVCFFSQAFNHILPLFLKMFYQFIYLQFEDTIQQIITKQNNSKSHQHLIIYFSWIWEGRSYPWYIIMNASLHFPCQRWLPWGLVHWFSDLYSLVHHSIYHSLQVIRFSVHNIITSAYKSILLRQT